MDPLDDALTGDDIYGILSHRKARRVLYHKLADEAGNIEELSVWAVPRNSKYPDGVRYRLAYILSGARTPAVLYDNHHPKGHHKHLMGNEVEYRFVGIDQLLEDFVRDTRSLE